MKYVHKFFLFSVLFTFSLGFRVVDERWKVTKQEPTLWVKFCSDITTHSFPAPEKDFPEWDPLFNKTLTFSNIMGSYFEDVNSIKSSFLRLSSFPPDPANPPTVTAPEEAFTEARAEDRTIEVCYGGTLGFSYASPDYSGSDVVGCKVRIDEDSKEDLLLFLHLVSHEVGHCIGLMHPQETTASVMSYHSPTEDNYRYQMDDVMGIVHMYPEIGSWGDEENSLGLSCSTKE